MEQYLGTISAQELFGQASKLALYEVEAPITGIASLGSMYHVATGVISLLFIFILVKYYNVFGQLIISFVSKKEQYSEIHSYGGEIKNIELVTSFAGLSLLALLVMRLSVMPELSATFNLPSLGPWAIGGITFVAALLLVCLERIIIYVVGLICEQEMACKGIWVVKQMHFCSTIILLTPLLILALTTEGKATTIALYCSVAVCSVSLILFIKETFLFFRAQRFSIFHWILYLCALEFFPLSLLLAPIVRGEF